MVQSLLRHAMAEDISEVFVNCLIVTSVADTNIRSSRECFVMLLTIALRLYSTLISQSHVEYRFYMNVRCKLRVILDLACRNVEVSSLCTVLGIMGIGTLLSF